MYLNVIYGDIVELHFPGLINNWKKPDKSGVYDKHYSY